MRRIMALAGVVVVAVLAAAPAAEAKCVPGTKGCPDVPAVVSVRATVAGPRLPEPLVIRGRAFWELARRAGASDYRPRWWYSSADVLFPGDGLLGPRYELRYIVRVDEGSTTEFVQWLYPYAVNLLRGGRPAAWTFTPEGQTFLASFRGLYVGRKFEVESGWWRSVSMFQTLVEHGLPETSPIPVSRAPAALPSALRVGEGILAAEPADEPGARTWVTLAALIALIALGALAGRPRRGRMAA